MAYNGKTSGNIATWNGTNFINSSIDPNDPLKDFPSYQSIYTTNLFSDFLGNSNAMYPFYAVAINSGATNVATSVANRLGLIRLQTGTNAGGGCAIFSTQNIFLGNGLETRYRTDINLPAVSDGTNTFEVICGFLQCSTTTFQSRTNGVYFYYTHSINSGNWVCVTEDNNVTSSLNSSVSPTLGTYQTLEFSVNSTATTASFYINGSFVGNITSNIPTSDGKEVGIASFISKSLGTTNRI